MLLVFVVVFIVFIAFWEGAFFCFAIGSQKCNFVILDGYHLCTLKRPVYYYPFRLKLAYKRLIAMILHRTPVEKSKASIQAATEINVETTTHQRLRSVSTAYPERNDADIADKLDTPFIMGRLYIALMRSNFKCLPQNGEMLK